MSSSPRQSRKNQPSGLPKLSFPHPCHTHLPTSRLLIYSLPYAAKASPSGPHNTQHWSHHQSYSTVSRLYSCDCHAKQIRRTMRAHLCRNKAAATQTTDFSALCLREWTISASRVLRYVICESCLPSVSFKFILQQGEAMARHFQTRCHGRLLTFR